MEGQDDEPTPKKVRKKTPQDIEDELLVSCNHRCCMCYDFPASIHHIDGNPSNYDRDNLIPLCPSHHNKIDLVYRMAKSVTEGQLKEYRRRWIEACKVMRFVAAAQITTNETENLRYVFEFLDHKELTQSKETPS